MKAHVKYLRGEGWICLYAGFRVTSMTPAMAINLMANTVQARKS